MITLKFIHTSIIKIKRTSYEIFSSFFIYLIKANYLILKITSTSFILLFRIGIVNGNFKIIQNNN